MLETLQGYLGCHRRRPLCLLPAGAFRSQICDRYVKLNLAIFHHISSACNSAIVKAIMYVQYTKSHCSSIAA